jgi:hypothetical protein
MSERSFFRADSRQLDCGILCRGNAVFDRLAV